MNKSANIYATKDDDLGLMGYGDELVPSDQQAIDWAIGKIDDILDKSIAEEDPYIAMEAFIQIRKIAQLSGLMLAKGLYRLFMAWEKFGIDELFTETVSTYTGLEVVTIKRYVEVWGLFEHHVIPEKYYGIFKTRNIKDLIPISYAIKQGYKIPKEAWDKIVETSNYIEVAEIIHKDVKHDENRSSALKFWIDKMGTLYVESKGKHFTVGTLNITSREEIVKKAIKRIATNVGLMVLE